jgi:predicted transcriptional regulator
VTVQLSAKNPSGEPGQNLYDSPFTYYNKSMRQEKIQGVPVSDATIESWAAEAEAGYPVEQLRKRGRKSLGDGVSEVIPVRMDQELLTALALRAEAENVSRSEAIRTAVRDWVNVA